MQLSLAELDEYDHHAKKHGEQWRFLCPLDDCRNKTGAEHRSLSVDSVGGAWICHRCDERGLLKEFQTTPNSGKAAFRCVEGRKAAKLKNFFSLRSATTAAMTPLRGEAAEVPCRSGDAKGGSQQSSKVITQFARCIALRGTSGVGYLHRRGIDIDLAHRSGVLFHPRFHGHPAVIFPINDFHQETVALHGRLVNHTQMKARNEGPKSEGVFTTVGALQAKHRIIVEAPIDALSLAMCGFPAVSLCGCGPMPSWLVDHWSFSQVWLGLDNDTAGDNGCEKLALLLGSRGCPTRRLVPESGKDFNEALMASGVCRLSDYLVSEIRGS